MSNRHCYLLASGKEMELKSSISSKINELEKLVHLVGFTVEMGTKSCTGNWSPWRSTESLSGVLLVFFPL